MCCTFSLGDITGCLRPTPTASRYLLSGIAPPEIQRGEVSSRERLRQTTDERNPLFAHEAAKRRLKSPCS